MFALDLAYMPYIHTCCHMELDMENSRPKKVIFFHTNAPYRYKIGHPRMDNIVQK